MLVFFEINPYVIFSEYGDKLLKLFCNMFFKKLLDNNAPGPG